MGREPHICEIHSPIFRLTTMLASATSASSRDGWLTQTVENIPVVGYIASAAHAVTGNGDLAKRAAVNCTGSTVAALGVVTGAVMTTASTVGVVTGGVVGTITTLGMVTGGVLATVKTLGAVTRAVVDTANLLGKGVKAIVGIAGNWKNDSAGIKQGAKEEEEENIDMVMKKKVVHR